MKRLVLVFLIAWLSAAPMAAEGDFTGRWTFSFDAGAYEQGTPQGARPPIPNYEAPAGAVITPVTVTLDVSALPGGGLVGTISGIQGVRWSGGGSPQGPVEIRDGRVDGVRLAFSAWRYDGGRNRMFVEGTLKGDTLELTLRRDSEQPYTTTVIATRQTRRTATTVWH